MDPNKAQIAAQLGAQVLSEGRTRFLVWAPNVDRVSLHLLGPVDRLIPLEPLPGGYFAVTLALVPAGARYLYRLADKVERPDPASRFQPDGVHQASAVVPTDFAWHDGAWRGLSLADYVLYELHVGTFTARGDFDGVLTALDALAELGVTAIELMPVAQFPGSRNWGYDGVHPFSVQNSYGGPAGLKRLIDACHARSLALVLDVVYNHLGPEGNYLAEFAPYFDRRHQTPWGPALNFAGPESDEVRRFFIDNALQWIDEFHVDALRLDAIHAIVDPSARPFLAELADRVHERAAELGRRVVLIAEDNRNDPRILASTNGGGLGLDGHCMDDFGRSLQACLTGERAGFYADFGGAHEFAQAIEKGYVLDGRYSSYRRRRHGAPSHDINPARFVVYCQTHDQVGNRPQSDRLSTLVDFESLKLAAAAVLLSPYVPLLFMGEEYGETSPFNYFTSHLDPQLAAAVRAGRIREFARFHWHHEPADPQAEATFVASRLQPNLAQVEPHATLRAFYRELIKLRRQHAALHPQPRTQCDFELLTAGELIIFRRTSPTENVVVCLNFNRLPLKQTVPAIFGIQPWQKVLDSADTAWRGPGSVAADVLTSSAELRTAPHSCVAYLKPTK